LTVGSKASFFRGLRPFASERDSRAVGLIVPLFFLLALSGCTSGGSGDNFQAQPPTPPGGGVTFGGSTNGQNPPPVVQSVTPTQGDSTGGTSITITGQNFLAGATVAVGGRPASQVTFLSATSIRAVTPAHPAGQVEVQVINPDSQRGTLFNAFTYNAAPAPLLTAISPVSGPSSGGTTVIITGSNFQSGATVLFGGASATNVMVTSATQISVTTPPNAAGTVDVIVRNPDSQFATLPGAFNYFNAPAPTITQVSPISGPSAGGTVVTITGTNFQTGAAVLFGSVPATTVTVQSPTQIQAVTPARAAGLVDVAVRNPDNQTATAMAAFTFVAGPTITSIAPTTGSAAGGTVVSVMGANFLASSVTFNGIAATSVTLVSSTEIRATTPAGLPGSATIVVQNSDGQTASLVNGFTYSALPPPIVTSVAPTSGPSSGGTVVLINGMNFDNGIGPNGGVLGVVFGTVPAQQLMFINSTQLQVTAPPNVGGPVDVIVINPDEQTGSLQGGFTYIPGPTVGSVSPASGPVAGGTMVSISGSAFQMGATVTFGGAAATNVMVVSATQITATVPANPAGAVTVRVTNPDGQFGTLANGYTYFAAPTVTNISPTSFSTLGGTTITINGTNFQSGATVLFGGVASPNVTFVSATQLTAVTPPGSPGPTTVQVVNPDGQSAMAAGGGTYVSPPTVNAAAPNRGPVAGGTVVVITGSDFQMGATVRFGATLATNVMFNSSMQLTATTPAGTAGAADIVVTNPDGQSDTLTGGFVYELPPAPVVNGISPSSGPTAGGTMVTITGANFVMGATVRIGGTLATNVMFASSTQLTATTPAGAAGDAAVQVTNPDGQSGTLAAAFTFVPPPTVTNVMPASGPVSGGNAITINGANFQSGATVTIGGAPATSVNFVSAAQLTAIAPAGVAGPATVVVTNPDGQVGTLAGGYTFVAPPDIVSINPVNGPPGGATLVTVNGSGFQPGMMVLFGNSVGSGLMFISSNQVTVSTPPRASGTVDVTVRNPDGQQDILANAFTYDAALGPMVTSVNPMNGPTAGGTLVTIMGSGFVNGATVWFGGNQGLNVMFISANEVRATTPAAAAGVFDVSVRNPNLETGTLTNGFTFLAPPTISAVSPNSGPAAGGTTVVITGSGFQNTPTVPTVLFGATPAATVMFNSSTQLTVTTAAGAGTVAVQVTNADGQSATQANAFTFVPAPTITNSTPASGPTAGGTQVTITGTGFQSGAAVFFAATPAASVTFVSSTQLRATSPASAAGTVDITVRNPDLQQATRTNAFMFIPPPAIMTVMPATGPTAGGTQVTIVGSDFRNTPTLPTVIFGGTAGTGVIFDSTMQLRVNTPAHAAGLVDVQVRNPDNQTATAMGAFTFLAAPTVSSVAPTSGPAAGNTPVTINGTNFVNGATVRFNGVLATNVMFVSPMQLTANTPAGAAGSATVQVTNPDGQSGSRANAFTYVGAPVVNNVMPATGPVTGGSTVTINGSNFQTGAIVRFGGTPATGVNVLSSMQITATLPAHAAGLVDVQVQNPDGQIGTLVSGFTFLPPPTISNINPTSGQSTGGTLVAINGADFQMGATVTFGGVMASSVVFVSPNQLQAVSPAGTAGTTVSVTVRNPDNQSATLSNAFMYLAPPAPTVTSVSPNTGVIAGNELVSVFGTNFQTGATVIFGGANATGVVLVSPNEIQCFTPPHAAGLVDVQVRVGTQTGTLTGGFTFIGPPSVTGVSPNSGPSTGGTAVAITGAGFQMGAIVRFGTAQAASAMVVSPTQIDATTPASTSGTVSVQVENPDGQTGTLSAGFTFTATTPPPVPAAVSPDSSTSTGGIMADVFGTSFQSGATVSFGGTLGIGTMFLSSSQLRTTIPPHADGIVDVQVQNPDGQVGTLAGGFTYSAVPPTPPTITTLSLPNTNVGVAYLQNLTATGGTLPYNWSIVSGSLPAGLLLDGSIGQIAGAATATGTSSFATQVTDASQPSQSDTDIFSIAVGARPTGTPVTACGVLATAGTTFILQNNVSAPETCFSIQADDISLDLNGRTITYATAPPADKARFGILGITCSDIDLGAGGVAEGNPCGGTFRRFEVRGPGTIQQSTNAQPFSHGIRLGRGTEEGLKAHDITINVSSGTASVPLGTVFGGGNRHIFNLTINYTLPDIFNRSALQGIAIRLDADANNTPGHTVHHNTIMGSPQGGIITRAVGSKIYSNNILLTGTFTNDFGIYGLAPQAEIFNNNIDCSPPRSCRGILMNADRLTVRNNTIVAHEVAENIEYGGCQLGGAYGIQFENRITNSVASNNTVTAISTDCEARAWRNSNTPPNGGNISRNNRYRGLKASAGGGFATSHSMVSAVDIVSMDDIFEADSTNVEALNGFAHNIRWIRPTFIQGPNPAASYVTFMFTPRALAPNVTRNSLFVQDPIFQNGASKDSFLMRPIGTIGAVAVEYFIQWTLNLSATDQVGTPLAGATVTITDALGQQAFVGTTDAFGRVSPVLNEFRRFNTSTAAAITETQTPHSLRISRVGCTAQTFNNIVMDRTRTQSFIINCP
jgi:hypothetical protein